MYMNNDKLSLGSFQQQKKRKADVLGPTEASNNNSAPVDAYTFDETDEPPAIVGRSGLAESRENNNQLHSSVSVNIVQQINTQADPQTNQIKLTVSSTLQTGLSNGSPKGGQTQTLSHASTSVETRTNICKQEPVDDAQCPGSANSSQNSFPDPIGLEDVDEIKAILDTLEKEEGELPPDLMKELDLGFKEAFEDSDNSLSSNQDTKDQNLSHKSPMFNSGTSTKSSPGPSMFADPLYDNSQATPSLNNMGGQGAAAMANYHRPPTGGGAAPPPPILPVGDTGPAAETLKQMAAQHQTQHQNQEVGGYGGVKGLPYGTDYADYTRRIPPHAYAHYQNYPMSGTAQANMYPYNQQVPMNNQRGHMAMQPMTKDPSLSYGATKPLSHYPGQMGQTGPSSLQQLQNQVQSHFSQGQPNQNGSGPGALQITQSQQMQMNHGSQRMQMSQSQQMQIHNAPHISVAQQQTFSMSPGMGPQQGPPPGQYHMNNQMKMQMMRHEQQQQQHGPPPQQGPPPHMQSYMNRPPPEYKVPPGSVNNNFNQNAMGANPLQTMQNMVNQTNQTGPAQNGMYPGGPPMKTEMPGGQGQIPPQTMGGNGCPTSATNMPGNRSSPLSGHNGANVRQSSPAGMPSYGPGPAQAGHAQMMQGQQMSMANGSATPGGMKPPTPTYTSAIMRNQRPPNVNVGPEGLNISQQRPHPGGEWPRTLTPGGAGGPGGGGPPTQGSPQQMGGPMGARPPSMGPNNSMMAYGGYQGQGAGAGAGRPMGGGHMNPGMPPNMRMQMSQQQGVMVSPSGQQPMARHMHPGGMAGHPPQAGGMMMQQQQGVQVTHHGNNMASMNMSQSMSTTVSTSQSHPQQQPPPQQQQQQPPPPPQQQQPQPPQQRHQPTPPQQQQQSSQQAQQQAPAPQQQQQQQPSTPQNQSNTQSPHGYPPQSSTQNSESEFPLDFLDNTQGNGSHDFFDSMVPNSNSSDLFDEFFCKWDLLEVK